MSNTKRFPLNPEKVYEKEWKGWAAFLGTEVRVVVCRVGKNPTIEYLPSDEEQRLDAMQSIVGGYIEKVPTDLAGVSCFLTCNEEGALEELPQNRYGIRGNFFICAPCDERGYLQSLTEDEALDIADRIRLDDAERERAK